MLSQVSGPRVLVIDGLSIHGDNPIVALEAG
jgi:hypothetical protein